MYYSMCCDYVLDVLWMKSSENSENRLRVDSVPDLMHIRTHRSIVAHLVAIRGLTPRPGGHRGCLYAEINFRGVSVMFTSNV